MNRPLHHILPGATLLGWSLALALWPQAAVGQAGPSSASIDSLRAAAEQGDAGAQYEYGRLYEVGADGIEVDYTVAFEWYERAAEQDHIPAMLSVSTMLLARDPQEAMRIVMTAAELGSAEAQWRAGQVYAGRIFIPLAGIDRDLQMALRWFQLGADQGHTPSLEAVANLYTDSDDPSQYVEGIEYYRRAADAGGSAWAVLRLGMIYAMGEGVEQSDATASEWFAKLGSEYELDPDFFADGELEVLGGLQAYYGLDFLGGDAEPDPAAAIESFRTALESGGTGLVEPFIHSSFQRISEQMLRRLQN